MIKTTEPKYEIKCTNNAMVRVKFQPAVLQRVVLKGSNPIPKTWNV